jgi:hypothetical protein
VKTEAPSTYREKYAAEAAGAVIQSAGYDTPGWDAILDEGEELQWQGWSQPKLSLPKGWIFRLIPGLVLIAVGAAGIAGGSGWGLRLTGGIMIALGILALIPWRLVRFLRKRRVFYSLSDRRAFRASASLLGKRKMMSWPITADTSFRLIRDDPPSVRFYEGRLESGRRPRYHAVFEAIPDAAEVYKLLLRIQKDAA